MRIKIQANDRKTYTLPTDPQWNKGRPPSIGWWPASIIRKPTVLRWWDGKRWSQLANPRDTEHVAAYQAAHYAQDWQQREMVWSDRWWLA